jgi:hypothetical protein
VGGPSRETLTGHQSDSSSPLTKGKARPLLQLAVIATAQKTRAVETMRKWPAQTCRESSFRAYDC